MGITPESVRELLYSQSLGDRLRGVNQVRELDAVTAFELIQVAIGDTNSRVRYSAVSQLDTLGNQNLELSLEILRELLNDPEPDVQAAAADCLGGLKLHGAFEDLERLYQNSQEWLVQFSIIAALGELGDPRAFQLLKQGLVSDNELVRTAAISSFGELGNVEAVPLLIPFATSSDWQTRYRVAQALCRLGGVEAKSVLQTLVGDEIEAVANEAQMGLS